MTINQIKPRLQAYLEIDGNGCGGHLHIYTDDDNIENCHLEYCYRSALEDGDFEGALLAEMILKLTYRQRRRLAYQRWHLR